MESLLSVKEVADFLRCPPKTIYLKAEKGFIPRPFKVGHLLRWRREDLEAWVLEKQKEKSA